MPTTWVARIQSAHVYMLLLNLLSCHEIFSIECHYVIIIITEVEFIPCDMNGRFYSQSWGSSLQAPADVLPMNSLVTSGSGQGFPVKHTRSLNKWRIGNLGLCPHFLISNILHPTPNKLTVFFSPTVKDHVHWNTCIVNNLIPQQFS